MSVRGFLNLSALAAFLTATGTFSCRAVPFDKNLDEGPIAVRIQSPNTPGENTVVITTEGLEGGCDHTSVASENPVSRAFLEDLDGDKSPELFVVLTNSGSGSYGELLAWSTNGRKKLSPVMIEKPTRKDLAGYMGHDQFETKKGVLIRRFPVYRKGDNNAAPTGGWREIRYTFKPGSDGGRLMIVREASD